MADFPYRCALIVGAGPGISASLARRLSKIGLQVGLAARDVEKLKPLAEEPPSSPSTPPSRSKWRSCSSTWNARSRSPIS